MTQRNKIHLETENLSTNILPFNHKAFRELANQMLLVADKAEAFKKFGPSVLKHDS